jgi:hypothetical protein
VGALKFHTFLTSPDLTKVPGLLDLTARAAVTDDAHEELAEAIVQFLDVSEDAHRRMMRAA